VDNDFAGDPDGLVQLAHHLLCPGTELSLVIGSQLAAYDPGATAFSADDSAVAARRVASLAGRVDVTVLAGSNEPLDSPHRPRASAAAQAIVAEAMRDDTDLPLLVACGAGLTNIASAWLMEPAIAERLTLVWIGGNEHADLAGPPPGALPVEYNASIDPLATRVVFDDADLPLWQVPRDAYRQVLVSAADLLHRMQPAGTLGAHLFDALEAFAATLRVWGIGGETVVLGDSPLVLLTSLWSPIDPAPSSSRWVDRPRPRIGDDGAYVPTTDGAPMRIFTELDTRLVLEDLFAKLELHARAQ
jgi:hypothetical protein